MVNYADYRLVYVAVSVGQKIFGFRKKNLLRDKLTTPSVSRVSSGQIIVDWLFVCTQAIVL